MVVPVLVEDGVYEQIKCERTHGMYMLNELA